MVRKTRQLKHTRIFSTKVRLRVTAETEAALESLARREAEWITVDVFGAGKVDDIEAGSFTVRSLEDGARDVELEVEHG